METFDEICKKYYNIGFYSYLNTPEYHKTHAGLWEGIKRTLSKERTFQSFLDVGCGLGQLVKMAIDDGFLDVVGVEHPISYDAAKNLIPHDIREEIQPLDATRPDFLVQVGVTNDRQFDIVISLEVAEHIMPESSEQFVKNLVGACSPQGFIIFTAAPVGQTGTAHINCQPQSFWKELFEKNGAHYCSLVTDKLVECWQRTSMNNHWWYHKNLMVFSK